MWTSDIDTEVVGHDRDGRCVIGRGSGGTGLGICVGGGDVVRRDDV